VEGDRVRFPGDLAPGAAEEVDLAAGKGTLLGNDPRIPDPYTQADGFFSQEGYNRFGRGSNDQFVPADASEEAAAAARTRMARAALGVSLAGISSTSARGQSRSLGRHGDPVGALPPGRNVRSTVVVVRRVLPAEEGR
jgi:hypothetical protein